MRARWPPTSSPEIGEHRVLRLAAYIVAGAIAEVSWVAPPVVIVADVLDRGARIVGVGVASLGRDPVDLKPSPFDVLPLRHRLVRQGFIGSPHGRIVRRMRHVLVGLGEPRTEVLVNLGVVARWVVRQTKLGHVRFGGPVRLLQRPWDVVRTVRERDCLLREAGYRPVWPCGGGGSGFFGG